MRKKHGVYIPFLLVFSAICLFSFSAILSPNLTVQNRNEAPFDPAEKLEYDIMTINAPVLWDFLNGDNKSGANPRKITADAIILQHQNPVEFEINGKRHEFRCIAYLVTATGVIPLPKTDPNFFVNDDTHDPSTRRRRRSFGDTNGGLTEAFANYYITKNTFDMGQVATSDYITLTPESFNTPNFKQHFIHYYIDYINFLASKKNVSTLNKILHALATDIDNQQKLNADFQSLSKQENVKITGGTNFINPSPPA